MFRKGVLFKSATSQKLTFKLYFILHQLIKIVTQKIPAAPCFTFVCLSLSLSLSLSLVFFLSLWLLQWLMLCCMSCVVSLKSDDSRCCLKCLALGVEVPQVERVQRRAQPGDVTVAGEW